MTACHHRTAPRMDDPEATMATAKVWARVFSPYNLELADLIAAVEKRAATNADAPEPAEIVAVAREIRRDRAEREKGQEIRDEAEEWRLDAERRGQIEGFIEGFGETDGKDDGS